MNINVKEKITNCTKRAYNGTTKAFSFIELILYISIFSIVMSALIPFAISALQNIDKSSVQHELAYSARLVSEKLTTNIQKAVSINTSTSNFGVNLASNPTYQLSLQAIAPNDPVIINVTSQGVLQIKNGSQAAVSITPSSVKVTDLTFTNNSSVDGKTKNITFTLSVSTNYTGASPTYQGNYSLRKSAEVRAN